ncbi:MAG: MFS transporter [Lachnospiraceae bacterium]|nr:MFS transporter [Lachnospiraceae bacterium]
MYNNTSGKTPRKFGMLDKLSYAAGDFGCNMSFALKGYLMVYWTQYMQMTESLYALLLVVVQIWDAINDPLIGAMIDSDRRKYKRGKFLAYVFAGSLGLLIAGAATFLPFPNAHEVAKIALFVGGYVFWDAFYTLANVPYGSMLPLISGDPGERSQLSSWRTVGSMVGGMVAGVIIPMVIYDENDYLLGERLWVIALFMGVLGFAAFQFFIRKTVVRVDVDVRCNEEQRFDIFKAIVNFAKNRPAIGETLAACAGFISMYGAQAATSVMFQSYFHNAQISGVMTLIGVIPMLFFMPFIAKITRKYGKKEASAFGCIFSIFACILMFVLPITGDMTGLLIYVGCQILNGIGMGVAMCVGYSMMADAIDYNEWKFGVRDEGTIYAIHSFFRKIAQGVFPSIGLLIATSLGYIAKNGPDQTPEVASNMRYLVAGMYLAAAIVQFISLKFVYNIDKDMLVQMNKELEARK